MTDPGSLAALPDGARAVLDTWFGPEPVWREAWFRADAAFDAAIADRFGSLLPPAARGALDAWGNTAAGAVALCVVMDQFPRNIHRGSSLAYAWDGRARALAGSALARGLDQAVPALHRLFLMMPFMHSENLLDQDRAVSLTAALAAEPWAGTCVVSASGHRDAIRRFGRFPARNAALGRPNTLEELTFLAENPEGF